MKIRVTPEVIASYRFGNDVVEVTDNGYVFFNDGYLCKLNLLENNPTREVISRLIHGDC